jgi:DNA-binding NarL/FixJ family response regulator
MRAAIEKLEPSTNATIAGTARRLRVVIADASMDFMAVVLSLLEFHEIVDLIGRASTFEEVVQLVVNHEPDVVLIDLDMPLANLAIAAIILSARSPVRVIGMCSGETTSMPPVEILTSMDASVHKEHLKDEFLVVLHSYLSGTAACHWISSSPKHEQAIDRWRSSLPGEIAH